MTDLSHDDDLEDYPQPASDKERTKAELPIGEIAKSVLQHRVEDIASELRSLARLDDEQLWAERDARIRKQRELDERQERAFEHRRRADLFKNEPHGFPAMAVDAACAAWPTTTPAMLAVQEYVKSPYLMLVLAGNVGTGKTSAAAWAALEVGGSSPAFLRASELEGRGRYDKELRAWLRTQTMLVIDDLGAEVLDDKRVFRSLLDEVVDKCYGDRRRLIITTNLRKKREPMADGVIAIGDPPQFVERYGERITSRMIQSGLWRDCGLQDLRRGARP